MVALLLQIMSALVAHHHMSKVLPLVKCYTNCLDSEDERKCLDFVCSFGPDSPGSTCSSLPKRAMKHPNSHLDLDG